METPSSLRIDKWLWAVRIYKTRTLAADACKGGKVKIEGKSVKASYSVSEGQVVEVSKGVVKQTYHVLGLLEKRLSAKDIDPYRKDLTPKIEKKAHAAAISSGIRDRGAGRPTKKERRDMDRLKQR